MKMKGPMREAGAPDTGGVQQVLSKVCQAHRGKTWSHHREFLASATRHIFPYATRKIGAQ